MKFFNRNLTNKHGKVLNLFSLTSLVRDCNVDLVDEMELSLVINLIDTVLLLHHLVSSVLLSLGTLLSFLLKFFEFVSENIYSTEHFDSIDFRDIIDRNVRSLVLKATVDENR